MIESLHIRGYRSLEDVRLPLSPLTVVTGPNGTGKSNLYRTLQLLARAARGELARALVEEGGMPSVLWSGPRRRRSGDPHRVQISIKVRSDVFGYAFACGLPTPTETKFLLDPDVKTETAWLGRTERRSTTFLERDHGGATLRANDGERISYPLSLETAETALAQIRDSRRYPDVELIREEFLGWRFYHQFRTDPESPLRQPQLGTRTPRLSDDGHDLAAALQTIREVGDATALAAAVEALQPGARIEIDDPAGNGWLELRLHTRGLLRPMTAREFSDGTLRYLALIAALLSPRPAPLLAFNEPETSLHPDLLPALAEQFVRGARRSQIWVTTHSDLLAAALAQASGRPALRLQLENGATRIVGQNIFGEIPGEGAEP